jgi:NAD+ synthase
MTVRPLPDELKIDCAAVTDHLVHFVRSQLTESGFENIVLGLSGGVDSAVVAALSVKAAGSDHVFPYLLPYRESSSASGVDALRVAEALQLPSETVDLSPMADPYFEAGHLDPVRKGNVLARLRMIVLFDKAKERDALVAGTGNKSEAYLGYTTLYGDSACSFLPIAPLYKSQVWQLALHLGLPGAVISKAPSADLWPGQTDEDELGITYTEIDRILYQLLDRNRSADDLVASGWDAHRVSFVMKTMIRTQFKRRLPPEAKFPTNTSAADTQS